MASNTFCATSAAVTLPLVTALSLMAWPISWLRVGLVPAALRSSGRLRWLWLMPVGTKYGHKTLALIFFCLGSITDFLDGAIARRRKLITNFGILMDPLADKILVCSAFIAFVEFRLNNVPLVEAWMVVVIVGRELAITGLRMLAASNNLVLAAEGLGKHKTISQITASAPVLVAQYANGGTFDSTVGDPFMMIIPPYEQFLGAYTISTPASTRPWA